MSMRSMVSYDDITLPYDHTEERSNPLSSSHSRQQPPAKKRKNNNSQKAKHQNEKHQNDSHFHQANTSRNASNSQSSEFKKYMNAAFGSNKTQQQQHARQQEAYNDEEMEVGEGKDEYEEEESRELTHEEIWDDSALVDAWESAVEEYEAYHGPEKDWKKEPVKKSPLWYNIPVDPSKRSTNVLSSDLKTPTPRSPSGPNSTAAEGTEPDSKPINFDTFVPMHDSSLDASSAAPADAEATTTTFANADYIPDTPAGAMVSQDEAFQRALSAMYWGGYWTAMYHCQRQLSQTQNPSTEQTSANNREDAEDEPAEGEEEEIEIDQDDEFISTQR